MNKKAIKITIPNAPICVMVKITSCPQNENCSHNTTVERPVVHTLDADTKKASMYAIGLKLLIGKTSNIAPIEIKIKKPDIGIKTICLFFNICIFYPYHLYLYFYKKYYIYKINLIQYFYITNILHFS